jgi:hypothetical protein
MRGRWVGRWTTVALGALVAGALVAPALVAAASPTYGFTESSPTPASVNYSDLTTLKGAYTCLNGPDASSYCPTSPLSSVATFGLRPSGGTTFTTVATVSSSFVFASSSSGCPTTCSVPFQVQWKAGRAGSLPVPPGTYDVRLTTTLAAGEVILPNALVVTPESTTTTYTGSLAGNAGTGLALNASVVDADRGLSAGTGIFYPDTYLATSTSVTFALYDATNTTLIVGPVTASLTMYGVVASSPTLTLPVAGTYELRTTYLGNTDYTGSSDLDTVTSSAVNTPPSLTVPGTLTVEATSSAGATVGYQVSATDTEDDPDPTPSCDPPSGSTFPVGTTTVDCTVTDSGGLSDSASFDVTVVDTTPPFVSVSTAESAAASGWYNAASNDGTAGVTVDVAASDLVGVAEVSCTDNGSPVGSLGPAGGSFVLGDGVHVVSCAATDAAGNSAAASSTFEVDQTPPTAVAFDPGSGLVDGGAYVFGSVPAGPTSCSASYDVSGDGGCVVSGWSGVVGDQAVTATATDLAGNVATAELHYEVLPWTLVGFAKPIDMTGLNNDKAGHQVRLKFQVWAGSTQLRTTDVVAAFTETQVSCGSGTALAAAQAATTKADLQVDQPGNFLVTWLTPSMPGTCWVATVSTLDGSSLSATFSLR